MTGSVDEATRHGAAVGGAECLAESRGDTPAGGFAGVAALLEGAEVRGYGRTLRGEAGAGGPFPEATLLRPAGECVRKKGALGR